MNETAEKVKVRTSKEQCVTIVDEAGRWNETAEKAKVNTATKRQVDIRAVMNGWIVVLKVPSHPDPEAPHNTWVYEEYAFGEGREVDACQLAVKYMTTDPWTWMKGEPTPAGAILVKEARALANPLTEA